MNHNEKTLKNIVTLIKGEGFNVKTYTEFGRYFIEFDSTGLSVTSLRRIIELIPSRSIISSSPRNRCFRIDTGISIKDQ